MPSDANKENIFAPQAYIVNLATLYSLNSFETVLDHFAQLHYQYANSWIIYPWFSKLWTRWKFFRHRSWISDYQLGKITNEHFLEKLSTIFYFLQGNVVDPELVIQNAWNSQINWNEQSRARLNALLQFNKPIYFIARDNQLHIDAIKRCIQRNQQLWQTREIAACQFDNYHTIALMSAHANQVVNTTDLLEKLTRYLINLPDRPNPILLVSQCDDDLDFVPSKKLGIYRESADQFYANALPKYKKRLSLERELVEEESTLSSHPRTNRITPTIGSFSLPISTPSTSSSLFSIVHKPKDELSKSSSQLPLTEDSSLINKMKK